jgi:SSS family solute:Na+ symporter
MDWILFWMLLYGISLLLIGIWQARTTTLEKYLVNNRSTGTWLLVATTLATFVGGGTSMGLITMGYESGFAAVGIGIAYVVGFFVVAKFARKIHHIGVKKNIYSFPQFLNKSYLTQSEKGFSRLFSLIVTGVNITIFFALLSAQFVGMASLLKFVLGMGYQTSAIISCLIVVGYTSLAGLSGVIITDLLQFIIILGMIVSIFIPGIMVDTENLTLLKTLPANMLDGTYYGIGFLIGLQLFIAPSVLVRMDIWQRMLAAKSDEVARKMNIISGIGMLPFYIIFPLAGMAVRLRFGADLQTEDATYVFLERHVSGFMMGFAVVGLLSVLMSSASSFLNVVAISAVRDFSGWGKDKAQASLSLQKKHIILVSSLFGLIALVLALSFPEIVNLMVVGIGTIAIFVPITLLALWSKNVHPYRKWAAASIAAGFVVNLGLFMVGIWDSQLFEPKKSFIPAFILSAILLTIGVLYTKLLKEHKK